MNQIATRFDTVLNSDDVNAIVNDFKANYTNNTTYVENTLDENSV
jgi:hypothetical protein